MDNLQKDIARIASIEAVPTILDVVCRTTGMGFAAVARVTEDQWIACKVLDNIEFGLKAGGELKVETTICHEIRKNEQPVIINHVAEDKVYSRHHTPLQYGFQSYISMPIILPDKKFFGTLCAIDPRPARVNTPEIIGMFKLFAELLAFHIDASDASEKLEKSNKLLEEEKENSELREQFMAVLSHDLRNPLGAISSGASLLKHMPLPERGKEVANMIQDCASRMLGLIENVLDLARSRLSGGILLNRDASQPLKPVLEHVVNELQTTHPECKIETDISITDNINCDHQRISQLLSNLLGNAITYGTREKPIRVKAISDNEHFELSVSNSATPIPPEKLKRLFHPFARGGDSERYQKGLGLGLYIASQIAAAHGGTLEAVSNEEETRFTFTMPLATA